MGSKGFDQAEHRTVRGKVVYRRRENPFQLKDVTRILTKMNEKLDDGILDDEFFDWQEIKKQYTIINEMLVKANILEGVKDELFEIFIDILSVVFPGWMIEIIEWVYNNVDAGLPPWYDAYIASR